MDERIKLLFSLSLSGSVLIATLFLLKPFYKKRLSKKWQYYIWIVVIISLLCPWASLFYTVTPITHLFNRGSSGLDKSVSSIDKTDTDTSITKVKSTENIYIKAPANFNNTVTFFNDVHTRITTFIHQLFNYILQNPLLSVLLKNIFLIWLCIAVILFVWNISSYYNFIYYIKAGHEEITNFDMWEHMGNLLEASSIKVPVTLFTNHLVSSPLLIGFFHPCIVLPSNKLSDTDFENTIRHEITHYKRLDMLYKWSVTITVCMHWFNPLVYLMRREINRLCELSCDEAVLSNLNQKARKEYGDTLLRAAKTKQIFKTPPNSVTLYERTEFKSKNLLKERLDAIMEFKKKSFLCTVLSLTMTCIITVSAAAVSRQTLHTGSTNFSEYQTAIKQSGIKKIDNTPNARIERKIKNGKIFIADGTYFILCGDAKKSDCPNNEVKKGFIDIYIVHKHKFADLGRDIKLSNHLADDVKKEAYKVRNGFTNSEAELVVALAKKIQAGAISSNDVKDISISKEYAQLGISYKYGKYYYNDKQLHCIFDQFANGSIKEYIQSKGGKVSLVIKRNKNGKVKKVLLLSNKEAVYIINAS